MSAATTSQAQLLELAVAAARAGGAELISRWRGPLQVDTKSTPTDPVSDADLASNRAILALLEQERTQDEILSEEADPGTPVRMGGAGATGGAGPGSNGNLRWVVDPLDGTVNYLYGHSAFAVSIAVQDSEGALAAAVLVPAHDELFTATRDGQPLCNGVPIAPGRCTSLDRALVGTGFGYDAHVRELQAAVAARVIPRARDIRRAGVAAVDMCWCASGRLDAYYERGVKPWDIAGGTLICQRVGLTVRELEPAGGLPSGVLVAPDALAEQLAALVV